MTQLALDRSGVHADFAPADRASCPPAVSDETYLDWLENQNRNDNDVQRVDRTAMALLSIVATVVVAGVVALMTL